MEAVAGACVLDLGGGDGYTESREVKLQPVNPAIGAYITDITAVSAAVVVTDYVTFHSCDFCVGSGRVPGGGVVLVGVPCRLVIVSCSIGLGAFLNFPVSRRATPGL